MSDKKPRKDEIVTFKVDAELADALRAVENRSAFIREALRNAIAGSCPLCQGSGTMTLAQRRHWEAFVEDHEVRRCADCHEAHLVCRHAAGEA
jgi:hypothetical protein